MGSIRTHVASSVSWGAGSAALWLTAVNAVRALPVLQ